MKRIKLVLSDLHLGGGRLNERGSTNPLEEFHFDRKFAEFLNYYCVGEFEAAEVELVLNGDFLNFLQVDYRGHFLTVITETIALAKLKKIIEGHPEVFKSLSAFLSQGHRGITYVIGNHDQAMMWPAVREHLNQTLGGSVKFINIAYYFDGVHIEHGHMHEPANRIDPKKFFLRKGYAEPILNLPMGSHFFVEFVLKLKERYPFIDKIRPVKRLIRWGVINETWATLGSIASLASFIFRAMFVEVDRRKPFSIKRMFQVLAKSTLFPDLTQAARRILDRDHVHTVIFGHTNVYQYRQFGIDKEYFNTGSWTDITSLDITSLGRLNKLTYVIVEYPEDTADRPRARLKEWRGFHRIEEDVAIS